MYQHPAVLEACVIAYPGRAPRRDREGHRRAQGGMARAARAKQLIEWCRQHMAAYKIPRIVEFADELPKSAAGKILWRELQARENARASR